MKASSLLVAFAARGHTPDASQQHAIEALEQFRTRIALAHPQQPAWRARLPSWLSQKSAPQNTKGVYLWGGVGRGKTLLFDAFCHSLTVPAQRVHFHRLMRDVHTQLGELRLTNAQDPLTKVAQHIARSAKVLVIDELFVSDIADAMIMGGLLTALIQQHVALGFTSNVPPKDLYRDGLQRARFLPAIELLTNETWVVNVDAGVDYRLRELEQEPLYFVTIEPNEPLFLKRFEALSGTSHAHDSHVCIDSRLVPTKGQGDRAVWFSFTDLCDGPRSTRDYIELSQRFDTVALSNIPVFDGTNDDAARRFIALIDEFYERHVKLLLSAAALPHALYQGTRLKDQFQRTESRLVEMQSTQYLMQPHQP
jgi:cell division protein ZapE